MLSFTFFATIIFPFSLFTGMGQLPEFKQFPLYHPSMAFAQVVPKLSSKGRDLLQVSKSTSK